MTNSLSNQLTKQTFPIKGMHCASCVRVIERSLLKTPGITDAVVNLATEKATVTFDTDKCSENDISTAVKKVGYSIRKDTESISEDHEKNEKIRELKILKNKVIVSLLYGGLILWGSFPGLVNTAPAILKLFYLLLSSWLHPYPPPNPKEKAPRGS